MKISSQTSDVFQRKYNKKSVCVGKKREWGEMMTDESFYILRVGANNNGWVC